MCFILFFGILCFVGCSSERELKKQSKKLNSYKININLDVSNMTASCYEKFEYKNRGESIEDSLVFHLYPTAFSEDAKVLPYSYVSYARCFPNGKSYGDITINEVKEDGGVSDYKIVGSDNDKLQINLKFM